MKKTITLMMVIMLAGKLMGILRDRMQAAHFGADTPEAIAFMQASSLPRNFFDIMFAAAFSASFIPVFNGCLETKGKKAAFDLAALFISVTLVLTVLFTVCSVLFAEPLYALILGGAAQSAETRALGVRLLRYMLPLIIISGLAFSFAGVLQSLGEFRVPAAMSVVSNGIILVYYFFFIDTFGVYGLAAAFLMGWASQALIQVPFLIKQKFSFRFRFNLKDEGLRQIALLTLPVMAASWVGPVNLLVNAKASVNLYGGVYGVNAIHFANNLFTIISGVFVLSVANVIFPQLSRQAAVNDHASFRETLSAATRSLFFFLLPLTFGLMALSAPLIRFVYLAGRFDETAVQITAEALFYFSLGIVGCGLQIVLSRACYSVRDGRSPLISAAAAIVLNASLSFILAPRMGVAGPALASAVSISAAAVILLISLTQKGHIAWPVPLVLDLCKMLFTALLMYFFVNIVFNLLANGNGGAGWIRSVALPAVVPALSGAAFYFFCCGVLGLNEMKEALNFIRRRGGNGKKL